MWRNCRSSPKNMGVCFTIWAPLTKNKYSLKTLFLFLWNFRAQIHSDHFPLNE
jgi:hypothetical protein